MTAPFLPSILVPFVGIALPVIVFALVFVLVEQEDIS